MRFVQARTPKGNQALYGLRDGTADGALLGGVIGDDEYRLATLPPLSGWGLDIGTYAGHVTAAMLADHPELRMVAVDPVKENCDILREMRNSWHDGRLVVVEGAATCDSGANVRLRYDYTSGPADHGYVHDNRFMAGIWRDEDAKGTDIEVYGYSIRDLAAQVGADRFVFTKIDCEGCEYQFLDDPDVDLLDYIIGEFHDGGPERITALLSQTHDVEILDNHGGTGIFRATIR